jgi:prolipoprotein diacylglyceryl transferase
VFAAVVLVSRLWERRGGERALVHDVALWAFPAGLIGGRLYFLATSWDEVPPHWWGPLAVWQGGLSIWGGIALGTVVGLWRLRRAGAAVAAFMDVAAPGLLVAQAIGRVGNYFNQELFGKPTSLPWGLEISAAHRPPGYEQFATFHPTFLYEALWDFGVAGLLIWLDRRFRLGHGRVIALYVMAYTAGRGWIEMLRIDEANHILGLRLNVWTSILVFLAGLAFFVWSARRRPGRESDVEPVREAEVPATAAARVTAEAPESEGEVPARARAQHGAGEQGAGEQGAGEQESGTKPRRRWSLRRSKP